jgi:uncharacterized protein (TIGR02147 family)
MAGSTSPNFLQLVRDRKLNISNAQLAALARALELKPNEEAYFETIAAFDHAKTHEEKDKFFQRILRTREYDSIKQLDKEQYEYFSNWYVPVVRELVVSSAFTGDPQWIARRIVPPVSEAKVRKAIELLQSLGLIERDGSSGRWVQTDSVISTPSEVLSLAITNYHRDVIALGREAVERFGPGQRDIRSVTLGLTPEGYAYVKERLETMWNELLSFAGRQTDPRAVYQVNMQFFPMSNEEGGEQ